MRQDFVVWNELSIAIMPVIAEWDLRMPITKMAKEKVGNYSAQQLAEYAQVVKLVDTPASGVGGSEGSSPFLSIKRFNNQKAHH